MLEHAKRKRVRTVILLLEDGVAKVDHPGYQSDINKSEKTL